MLRSIKGTDVTTNQPQDRIPGESGASGESAPAITAKGLSRRRFGRAGLGASGVLMTLASQPAMAQALCATASGSLSTGMQSRHSSVTLPACDGLPPGEIVGATTQSKGQLKDNGHRFKDYYATSFVPLRDAKVADILRACANLQPLLDNQGNQIVDAATIQVAGHMVAAMLNLQARLTTVNDEKHLKSIWNAYELSNRGVQGYYSPAATVNWYHDGIVRYIKTTYKGGSVPRIVAP